MSNSGVKGLKRDIFQVCNEITDNNWYTYYLPKFGGTILSNVHRKMGDIEMLLFRNIGLSSLSTWQQWRTLEFFSGRGGQQS
jgi:hypothetical protein